MRYPTHRSLMRRAARPFRLPPSLALLARVFRMAEWELFAALAAVFALPSGLGFLFYPHVFELSKSYVKLAELFKVPQPLGAFAVAAALMVLLGINNTVGRFGMFGIVLFWTLLFLGSLASVGLSGGTALYFMFLGLAIFGYLRSGGVELRRDP